MRQPTFSRARQRQQRLLRTGIGVVVLVAVAAVLANLLSDDEPPKEPEAPPGTPVVNIRASARGFTEIGGLSGARPVAKGRVRREQAEIVAVLEDLYQRAFVDPSLFVEADAETPFPPAEVQAHFGEAARPALAQPDNVESLTLGTERARFERVEPGRARAKISIYFRGGEAPTIATAAVRFVATGTLKGAAGPPVEIEQEAVYHMRRTGDGWIVEFFEAEQRQESIRPSPSPTATSS